MDTLEAIHSRRSVRRYQDKPVPEELVRKLLAAGMSAPSARDAQEWQFVVIDDKVDITQNFFVLECLPDTPNVEFRCCHTLTDCFFWRSRSVYQSVNRATGTLTARKSRAAAMYPV